MKTHALLVAGCLLAAPVCTPAQTLSGPVTNSANGHLYYLLSGYVTWNAAEAAAVATNGHLATVRSAAETDWLQNTFRPAVGHLGPLWIGLNDFAVEGDFQWRNGDPLLYSNWDPSQPDNFFGAEDAVYLSSAGGWNDSDANFVGFVEGAIIEVVVVPPLVVRLQFTTNALISWNSQSNVQYQVQYSSLPTANSWSNLNAVVTATGTNSTVTNSGALPAHRFYRVLQLP